MRPRTCLLLAGSLLLATATAARAELTVQGWLDFYEGKTQLPAPVASIAASSYVLGVADSAISLRVMSCPKGYNTQAQTDALSDETAQVLKKFHDHPGMSVTAAVLIALAVVGGCTDGPRGKAK